MADSDDKLAAPKACAVGERERSGWVDRHVGRKCARAVDDTPAGRRVARQRGLVSCDHSSPLITPSNCYGTYCQAVICATPIAAFRHSFFGGNALSVGPVLATLTGDSPGTNASVLCS